MIDLTPPEFTGHIGLHGTDADLVVKLRRQDFIDDEDDDLQFHVAIGMKHDKTLHL